MKRLLSILTVFLVLTGMLHFSVARHYCGGNFIASKISLSGDLASCGMEDPEGNCPYDHHSDRIESNCCDDVLTSISIDNNYTPAAKTAVDFSPSRIAVPDLPDENPLRFSFIKYHSRSGISPPDLHRTSSVDLSDIRVLRI